MPYCDILINTAEQKGLRKDSDKHSYADDTHFTQGKFYEKLCDETHLRNFDEFWEKYFEIGMSDHIGKPLDFDLTIKLLSKYLHRT